MMMDGRKEATACLKEKTVRDEKQSQDKAKTHKSNNNQPLLIPPSVSVD